MRAFRHTCTLIGMTLVTSLIDIAKMVQMDLENTERQLETELKKGQAKRAFAKVGELYYIAIRETIFGREES